MARLAVPWMFATLFAVGGCATALDVYDGPSHAYAGTSLDAGMISGGIPTGLGFGPPDHKVPRWVCLTMGLAAVVDLPISFVGDTLALPWSIPAEIERKKIADELNQREIDAHEAWLDAFARDSLYGPTKGKPTAESAPDLTVPEPPAEPTSTPSSSSIVPQPPQARMPQP